MPLFADFTVSLGSALVLLISILSGAAGSPSWSEWWRYQGISGPEYWGRINPDWSLCDKGKQQSPIDIDPRTLVYDPNLRPFTLQRKRVNALLINTGRDVTMMLQDRPENHMLILTGPFTYRYRLHSLNIHFGSLDMVGSEHTIAGQSFTAEIHLLAYNIDLYKNFTHAVHSPHGLASVAIFATVGDKSTNEFEVIVKELKHIIYKDETSNISGILLSELLPKTDLYMTYDGSLTQPGCQETVTWIVLNKPLYVTKLQMRQFRKLNQIEKSTTQMLMEDNLRPTMPLNRRTIRTNISPQVKLQECATKKESFYQGKAFSYQIKTLSAVSGSLNVKGLV